MYEVVVHDDQQAGGRGGVTLTEASIAARNDGVTLTELPNRETIGRKADLAKACTDAARFGLAVMVKARSGKRPPRDWARDIAPGCTAAWLMPSDETRWTGEVHRAAETPKIDRITIVETGETFATTKAGEVEPAAFAADVWDPVQMGVGERTFMRVRTAEHCIVGAGRNGTRALETLASSGAAVFSLVDDDILEPRNRNGPTGTEPREPAPKAEENTQFARAQFGLSSVHAVVASVVQRPMLDVMRRRPVLVGCADAEVVRFAGALYASAYGVPHVDMGAGVQVDGDQVVRGGQVVAVPPGTGCLACVRDLRWEEVERDLAGDAASQRESRLRGERRGDTHGTVPDILARVSGTAVGQIRRWHVGELDAPVRLWFHDGGLVEEFPRSSSQPDCPICALACTGDALLSGVFPPVSPNGLGPRRRRDPSDYFLDTGSSAVDEILTLSGAATAEVLLERAGDRYLAELVMRLSAEGLSLEWPPPLGPALAERVPNPQGVLRLVSLTDAEETWAVLIGDDQQVVTFRPERRWLPLMELVREQFRRR